MALKYEVFDGSDLPGPVYRIVERCPPTAEDFRSYAETDRSYSSYAQFRATGISAYLTLEGARAANAKFSLGGGIATLDLNDNRVVWAKTGHRDHITAWATSAVFLECVLTCA